MFMFKEDLGLLLIDMCWPFHVIIDMSGFSSPILLLASSPSFHFFPPLFLLSYCVLKNLNVF